MSPHRSTRASPAGRVQTGTFIIDRVLRHVGRIRRASGTTHRPTFRRLNEMLDQLAEQGYLDVLRAIRDGQLAPLDVYAQFRRNGELPTAVALRSLREMWDGWLAAKVCADSHRASLKQSWRHLQVPEDAVLADLPRLLETARDRLTQHPQSFRLCKSAAQAFVKATCRRTHSLYRELSGIETLRVTPMRHKHPATPAEIAEVAARLESQDFVRVLWALATTGMRLVEYRGPWRQEPGRIAIRNGKQRGPEVWRVVPNVGRCERVTFNYKMFLAALRDASSGQMTPYDTRRSYANWLEAAGIPRTRRRLYMGHGARDVTDLYEAHEVRTFIADDAARLSEYLSTECQPIRTASPGFSPGVRLKKA